MMRRVAQARPQHIEAATEQPSELGRGKDPQPGGRQLDRQRKSFEAAADLGDRGRLAGADDVVRVEPLDMADEQPHRLDAGQVGAGSDVCVRDRERLDDHDGLARRARRHSRRDDEAQFRAAIEESSDVGDRGDEMLGVVEHEQRRAFPDSRGDRVRRQLFTGHVEPSGRSDGRVHEVSVRQRGELDVDDGPPERVGEPFCDLDGEPCLADARRTGDRHQAAPLLDEAETPIDLRSPADDRFGGSRQGVRVRRRVRQAPGPPATLADPWTLTSAEQSSSSAADDA